MPRAVSVFQKLDWDVVPFPVDFKVPRANHRNQVAGFDWRLNAGARLTELDLAAKEWIGLLVYWVVGRTESLLPEADLTSQKAGPRSALRLDRAKLRLR